MDARTARRNEVDAWANEGHWVHHFVQFAEPTLVELHRARCRADGVDPLDGGPRARALAGLGARANGWLPLALGDGDERFPELSAPVVAVFGVEPESLERERAALAAAMDVLAAVHQRCFVELAVGAVLVAPTTSRSLPIEVAWVPAPAARGVVANARLLLVEAVDRWLLQLAAVEHAKERSTDLSGLASDWEAGFLRHVSVCCLEYELHRRLLDTQDLQPADREWVSARRDPTRRFLADLEGSLVSIVNERPSLPLMKDFLVTGYPCWDRSPYYERPFDREGRGAIRVPPLTPDGELSR